MKINTNGNVYTIIYSTIIVVAVAAVLAFTAMSLKPRKEANVKAETIRQMLTAAQLRTSEELGKLSNDAILAEYAKNIDKAFIINEEGDSVNALGITAGNIELADDLKARNKEIIKSKGKASGLPVYVFKKDGKKITVLPCYGAGLWGPVWGYIAFDEDLKTIIGAYFDHESETPGLGAKIKDDPSFRSSLIGKNADFSSEKIFEIIKGGVPEGKTNAIDAITGATMTTTGLNGAINTWLEAYKLYMEKNSKKASFCSEETECSESEEYCCYKDMERGQSIETADSLKCKEKPCAKNNCKEKASEEAETK